ncbi:MAG TPA: PEP-CTERM sorting domain-containing protein [Gemmatales bacterium]|nr:PEP-CTERM sorting domain-containing protein [Gemmatales bacterium]
MLKNVFILVSLLFIHNSILAQSTIYTSAASFLPLVAPGSYTETFTGNSGNFDNGLTFSFNGFTYTIDAGPGLEPIFRDGLIIGNTFDNEAFTFTFTSNNVTAIGGNFVITDVSGNPLIATISITLSDGTNTTYTTNGELDEYRGFISPGPVITSLTLAAPGAANFNTVDNFTVGVSAVPEPATIVLSGMCLLVFFGYWYRRRHVSYAAAQQEIIQTDV